MVRVNIARVVKSAYIVNLLTVTTPLSSIKTSDSKKPPSMVKKSKQINLSLPFRALESMGCLKSGELAPTPEQLQIPASLFMQWVIDEPSNKYALPFSLAVPTPPKYKPGPSGKLLIIKFLHIAKVMRSNVISAYNN
ncbi:hypothetical protein GQX74_014652 [Glossina fuscipes]|nr:hypothetical protein GQX74_014652 [Glossina fuscipes]